MSRKVKEVLKNLLFAFSILNLTSFVFGDYILRFDENPKLKPKLFITVGSRQVELKLNKDQNFISLFDNQEVQLQCDTTFQYPESLNTENKFKLKCGRNNYYGDQLYSCSPQNWNLYETFNNFTWCPTKATSYLLARPINIETKKFQYLAGVCSDPLNLAFKSLFYTISADYAKHLNPIVLSEFYEPSLELKYVKETFGSKSVEASDYESQDIQDWVNYAQYNYSSIIQNTLLLNDFSDQFGSLLDLAWWPSLRLGNWKRYESALARHIENQKKSFDILAGVSEVATAPIIQVCQTNFTLTEIRDNRSNKIPMYVWNYLRSTDNSSDDIVIIGINSPFYEFYLKDDIVFCPDKCQEISWLKKVSTTFRFSALGIIFCCSSDDVKSSKRVNGFPEIDINKKPKYKKMRTVNFLNFPDEDETVYSYSNY